MIVQQLSFYCHKIMTKKLSTKNQLILKNGFKKKLDSLEIKSYDLENSILRRNEFIISGMKCKYLIILSGKDKSDEIEWLGKYNMKLLLLKPPMRSELWNKRYLI